NGCFHAAFPHAAESFSLGVYLFANVIVFVDLFDFLMRIQRRRVQSPPQGRVRHVPTSTPIVIGRFNPYQRRLHLQPYAIAISVGVGRKSLGVLSVSSGISLYRRKTLERVLREHSLSVYAEDRENTLHLIGRDERIYYDERLVVETEGKADLASWFSQRVGW